ncbi:MAG: polysaccharide biosynthesis tyrosine autokinase [Pirellulales bacterium]|nr:polysaccharide biosynthesis tyrosine autokinase [Pirellulales bacterium]
MASSTLDNPELHNDGAGKHSGLYSANSPNGSTYGGNGHGNGNGIYGGTALIPRPEPTDLAPYNPYGFPGLAADAQDASPTAMSFAKLYHAFRRQWLLASFVGLLLAIPTALGVWFMLPDSYEVSALLKCNYDVNDFIGKRQGVIDHGQRQTFRETQIAMLKHEKVFNLAKVYTHPKHVPTPITSLPLLAQQSNINGYLAKMLTVVNLKGSDFIEIRMTGSDPAQVVQIVRALAESYLKYHTDEEQQAANLSISNLDAQIKAEQAQIGTVIDAIRSMEEVSGALTNEGRMREIELLRSEIARDEAMLMDFNRKRNDILERIDLYEYMENEKNTNEIPRSIYEAKLREIVPEYKELSDALGIMQRQLNDAVSTSRNKNTPTIRSLDNQIVNTKARMDQLWEENKENVIRHTIQNNNRLEEYLPVLKKNQQRIEGEMARLTEALKTKQAEFTKKSYISADLENKRIQRHDLETKLRNLNNDRHEAERKLEGLKISPTVVLYSEPEVPPRGNLTYQIMLTSFAGVVSLLAGVASVVLWENSKHRVNTVQEIGSPACGLRVLGTVPNLARLGSDTASSVLAESIDGVRTMLLQNRNREALRIVLVSSPSEGEGKTTVATHLAASLARAGRRTLLVDGDLRKPTIHHLFGLPQSAGLSEVLRSEAELEAVIHPAHVEGLYLMQAGVCDHNSLAALAKEHAEAIFRTLRADFDYIIIDSGPVLGFADALLLGGYADTAVLSVLRDVSQITKVNEARGRLDSVGIPILGTVVGRAPEKVHRALAG